MQWTAAKEQDSVPRPTMRFSVSALAALAIAFVERAAGVAPTDSYRDADTAQSGYLPNHNMDPAVVDSSQFGQLWKVQFNSLEQVSHGRLTSSFLLSMALVPQKRGCEGIMPAVLLLALLQAYGYVRESVR